MIYTYKNLKVNVSNINPHYVQDMGETIMTIHSEFVAELLEHSCSFFECYAKYDGYELYCELGEDHDELINHFKNLDSDIQLTSPDDIISVYEYALEESDKEFEFDVETENISWVIHDILHAEHDASGCSIYVDRVVEKQRILESLEITKELFPSELPDYTYLEKIQETYYKRFKHSIDLSEFMLEEEMYY